MSFFSTSRRVCLLLKPAGNKKKSILFLKFNIIIYCNYYCYSKIINDYSHRRKKCIINVLT